MIVGINLYSIRLGGLCPPVQFCYQWLCRCTSIEAWISRFICLYFGFVSSIWLVVVGKGCCVGKTLVAFGRIATVRFGSVRFGLCPKTGSVRFGSSSKLVPEILYALRSPTNPPQVAQNSANLAQKWSQNRGTPSPPGAKNGVPHRPTAPKMEYPIGPRRKISKRKFQRNKKGADFQKNAPFGRKRGQHCPNLVPKMEPRWSKNRSQNRSFFWYILGSIIETILVVFCNKTKPSWHQNWIENRIKNQL